MPKLKPLSIGLTLGVMISILYTLRTIFLLSFPNFVVNVANKVMYGMIKINMPVVTIGSFIVGVIALFLGGMFLGIVFSLVYNWVGK